MSRRNGRAGVDDDSSAPAFRDAVPTHRCPHCRQPLAVISVLVLAAVAHIDTPEVTHA
jgi:hypothetical protein